MPFELTIPARINILGNPADATEGDFATISAAVNLRAGARVELAEALVLEQCRRTDDGLDVVARQTFPLDALPLPYDGELDLVKGAVNRLYFYSVELREKLPQGGVRVATWTDVPRQSGLGGSSLFVLLTLAGFRPEWHHCVGEREGRICGAELHPRPTDQRPYGVHPERGGALCHDCFEALSDEPTAGPLSPSALSWLQAFQVRGYTDLADLDLPSRTANELDRVMERYVSYYLERRPSIRRLMKNRRR